MRSKVAGIALAAILVAGGAYAQGLPATPQDQAEPDAQTILQAAPERLDQLLAPIALDPDDLLGDILMAATYPLEVVEAARWVQAPDHALQSGDQLFATLENEDWDPSVKSLAQFPRILRMMADELDWTERLGEAFLADQAGVMDSIQRLRQRAQSAGRLVSFPGATVMAEGQTISIKPSTPDLVYVPVVDPTVVYGSWPYPAFPPDNPPVFSDGATVVGLGCRWLSVPIAAPFWGWHHVNWRRHDIDIDRDRFIVLNRNHPSIEGDTWGHDLSHRHDVQYRDSRLRARFGGATPSLEARPALRVGTFPTQPVSVSPPVGSEAATGRIEPTFRRRAPPVFEPFSRGADLHRFPAPFIPRPYPAPRLGNALIGEPATQRIEPTARTHVPPATVPFVRAPPRGHDAMGALPRWHHDETFKPPFSPWWGAPASQPR
jgi:hypothetical protein